jgi:hypothetical protein
MMMALWYQSSRRLLNTAGHGNTEQMYCCTAPHGRPGCNGGSHPGVALLHSQWSFGSSNTCISVAFVALPRTAHTATVNDGSASQVPLRRERPPETRARYGGVTGRFGSDIFSGLAGLRGVLGDDTMHHVTGGGMSGRFCGERYGRLMSWQRTVSVKSLKRED